MSGQVIAGDGGPGAEAVDERAKNTELLISTLLRAGVLLSVVLVVAGVVVTFAHHPDYLTSQDQLDSVQRGRSAFPTTIGEVVRGLAHMQGRALVMAGLLVLIATPIMRVAVSIIAFLHLRDRTFVVITSTVLALLMVSLFLGKAGG